MALPDSKNRWVDREFEHKRCNKAADHGGGDTLHDIGAGTHAPQNWQEPNHGRHDHHEFRPHALRCAFDDGLSEFGERCELAFSFFPLVPAKRLVFPL